MITLITGGERSGKSRHAQQLALGYSPSPIYLATARRWDEDFEYRILRHEQERDSRWRTVEEEINIGRVQGEVIVVDCVTLWLTNIFSDANFKLDQALSIAQAELNHIFNSNSNWIFVTNEIGMGVHAPTEAGRKFVELQGWVNQLIAGHSSKVILMISGVPLVVKQ